MYEQSTVKTFVLALTIYSAQGFRLAAPKCDGFKGTLKYEIGKSYYYQYEAHFSGFNYGGDAHPAFNPNPAIKIDGTVVLTFESECEIVLGIENVTVAGGSKGSAIGTVSMKKSFMKFFFNNGLVDYVHINNAESAWEQNLKRGILSMIQNSTVFTKQLKTHENSIYGHCETTYDKETGAKTIHLTNCSLGEYSDLIAQGVRYQLPHIQNKLIFGALRPARFAKCAQTLKNGLIAEAKCEETDGGYFGMEGLTATLKYTHSAAKTLTSADLSHVTQPSTLLYNFTSSFSAESDSKPETQISLALKLLKADGSNKAEIYLRLKKSLRQVVHLDTVMKSDLLKEEMHLKTVYDAMAEVVTDECIRLIAKGFKHDAIDEITLLKFSTSIAFVQNPGPSALSSMTTVVKGITKKFSTAEKISVAQHLLLGASGMAWQFCQSYPMCATTSEYIELVDEIADHLHFTEVLKKEKATGLQEVTLATLQALGNLPSLTPKAVKALVAILDSDLSKTPEWLLINALEAFRRDPCSADGKKSARKIFDSKKHTEQTRTVAYVAMSKCLVPDDVSSVHEVLKTTSDLSSFIATHARSLNGSSSPGKFLMKTHVSQISIPKNVAHVPKFSRASQYIEYSAFSDKENAGGSVDATIYFDAKESKPQFISAGVTFDLFGRSFQILEIGFSQRLMSPAERNHGTPSTSVPEWCCVQEAAVAKDSYIRIFGTTVSIGLDLIHETVQTSLKKLIKGDKTSWNFKAILPSTLLDEQVSFPTLVGMPLTLDLGVVEFDTADVVLSSPGQKDLDKLMSKLFQFPYDYKVNIHAAVSMMAHGGLGLGAHTPLSVGHRVMAKFSQRSAFGVELSASKGALMDFKLNFPQTVIDAKEIEAEGYSYVEVMNGGEHRLTEETKRKARSVAKAAENHSVTRKCFLTGLSSSASWNTQKSKIWYKSTLEKTDEKMKGFEVKVKDDGKHGYKASMSTPGSKVSRELSLTYSQAHGTAAKSAVVKCEVESHLGDFKQKGSLTLETKPAAIGSIFPTEYSFVAEIAAKPHSLKVFKATISQPVKGEAHVTLDIIGIINGQVNMTIAKDHIHTDSHLKLPIMNAEATVSDDLKFTGAEVKRVVHQVVKIGGETLTVDTTVVGNMAQRSFQLESSSERVAASGVKLTGKLHANAKFPQDMFNGRTTAALTFEENGKPEISGSFNETNAMTKDAFTSDAQLYFKSPAVQPLTYSSKLKYDWHNSNPTKHDFERHVSIEKEIKGVFMVPFDFVINDEIGVYKETGKETYVGFLKNNITEGGKFVRQTEVSAKVISKPGTKSVMNIDGFTTDTSTRDDLTAKWTGDTVIPELNTTSNWTAVVTRTPLKGDKKVEELFAQSVNQSWTGKNLMDFVYLEDGLMKFFQDNEIGWNKELTVHPHEFHLFEQVKEKEGRNGTFHNKFLLDISARLYLDDGGHPKLGFKTMNSIQAQVQTLNLTLSR